MSDPFNNMIAILQKITVQMAVCAAFILPITPAPAAVRLPAVLSSHMVLQQGMAVPIWGTADPNEAVTVKFRDQQKTATADAQGKWMVKLDPLKPGGPDTLTISGSNTITLDDVLVGEVWLGSGQSNMDTLVSMYAERDPPLKQAMNTSLPQLRLFRVVQPGGWQVVTPDNVNKYPAELFYFGMLLQKELNVPVGVMEGAQGGTPSLYFISQQAFNADPTIQPLLVKWDAEHPIDVLQTQYEAALAKWKVDMTAALAAYSTNAPATPSPTPGAALSIAPSATPTPTPTPAPAPTPVPDISSPKTIPKPLLAKYPLPQQPVLAVATLTGACYERLVRPMIPYGIRGVLWDQGESGTGLRCITQPILMSALIRDWRDDWGQGDFPWIYVQKPSGGGCALNPEDPVNAGAVPFVPLSTLTNGPPTSFASTHVEGYSIMTFPNTFLAIVTDLAPGIHPFNKSGYATRESRVALGAVYGEPIEYYGPIFQSFTIAGSQVTISYTHTGKGLTVPPGQKLQGFALAGADKKWHWADAAIDGQTVVLSSPDVPAPVAARYWPFAWANLFNIDGLPASGFRTDTW
ncbi:MAG: sialate O-acetylesterase [Methylacidiphilales bacterium]|nr:sialate O-acetylesterase [Candidatus Methylacidiphilales bacterium]